jgi:quercetin 2,3-dioxygenase
MKKIIYTAQSRGSANHGWLRSHFYFSFSEYYNPSRIHFGALRVINDDIIQPEMGFGTHPHENMEIITIPFTGNLSHKDSMGNSSIIKSGDIQVMSAGIGIQHSEWNNDKTLPITLFQIWIYPNKRNVNPRYQQLAIRDLVIENEFSQILSPNESDNGVWIYQDAWMNLGTFIHANSKTYNLHSPENGLFAVIISGNAKIANTDLQTRDAIGIWETDTVEIEANDNTQILLIEVPMNFTIS